MTDGVSAPFAFHLVVEIPQIGRSVGVAGDAVEPQPERIRDPQPAADEDHGDEPVVVVAPSIEVAGMFDLGHNLLGERPWRPLGPLGLVLNEEQRGGGQGFVPAMLADGGEEAVQQPDMAALTLAAAHLGLQDLSEQDRQALVDLLNQFAHQETDPERHLTAWEAPETLGLLA